jgi:hypothetical protein
MKTWTNRMKTMTTMIMEVSMIRWVEQVSQINRMVFKNLLRRDERRRRKRRRRSLSNSKILV